MRHLFFATCLFLCGSVWSVSVDAQSPGVRHTRIDRHAEPAVDFVARREYPVAWDLASVESLAIGDLNEDGRPDFVTTNSVPPEGPGESSRAGISVLFGADDGTFGGPQGTVIGDQPAPMAIAIGDFDGDRHLDLATAGRTTIWLLIGHGDGTFEVRSETAVSDPLVDLVAADFNGDHRLDLAFTLQPIVPPFGPQVPGSVSVLLGQGDGTFLPSSALPVTRPLDLKAADFNADEYPDLAVLDDGNRIFLLLGDGDGVFQPQLITLASGPRATLIEAADFNADGWMDLSVVRAAPTSSSPASLEALFGDGAGLFQPGPAVPVPTRVVGIAAGDLNRDRLSDVVLADVINGFVTIALSRRNGTFDVRPGIQVGAQPLAVAIGDFNRDGRADLVTGNRAGTISVLLTDRGRHFRLAPTLTTTVCCPSSVALGDFNGDGRADLADALFPGGMISVHLGAARGRFQSMPPVAVSNRPWRIAPGDFNGDARLDLAITHPDGGSVSIAFGSGDGGFAAGPEIPVGTSPNGIVAGDFNRDGVLDLAVTLDFTTTIAVLLGHGDGTFLQSIESVGPQPYSVAAADLDGNNCLDLVVTNRNRNPNQLPGSISVLLGDCNGTFHAAPELTVGSSPSAVAISDFNGDGRPDLAVVRPLIFILDAPSMAVFLGNGDGSFVELPPIPVSGEDVAAADFDGDGVVDLAVANISNYVTILTGRGDGTFDVLQRIGAGSQSLAIVAADLDDDGRPDLATADYNAQTLSLLMNDTRFRRHQRPHPDPSSTMIITQHERNDWRSPRYRA